MNILPYRLAFVVPFVARMGQWDEAESLLPRLEKKLETAFFLRKQLLLFTKCVVIWRNRSCMRRNGLPSCSFHGSA